MKNLFDYVVGKPVRIASVFLAFVSVSAFGEIIPADRRVVWEGNVGIPGGIPTNLVVWCTNITTFIPGSSLKAKGDGVTDDSAAVSAAIKGCPAGQVIRFPAGTFVINSGITMGSKGVILRGAGASLTTFKNCTIAVGSGPSVDNSTTVLSGSVKGATTITVGSTSGMAVGKIMNIEGGDDSSIVKVTGYETTALAPAQWQIVQITGVSSPNVSFTPPLYWDMKTNSSITPLAKIYHGGGGATNYTTYAGLENFRLQPPSGSDTSIQMSTVFLCWIKGVEVDHPRNHCIYLRRAFRCQIFGSYLHDATVNGSGGGYGVTFENGCCANLVENNITKDMTGAFQVNEGSSGNVFAYNYIVSSDYYDARYTQPDFQNHSAHPLMNLWEGNVGFMALFDDIHGSSSHHTLFRNRLFGWQNSTITHQEYCIGIEAFTSYCNIIGNVLGESHMDTYMMTTGVNFNDSKKAIYAIGYDSLGRGNTLAQDTVLIHGNWDSVTTTNGGLVWGNNPDHVIPKSLYLSNKPAWFGNRPWPPIDPNSPSTAVATNIPAGYRWVFGIDPPSGPINLAPVAVATITSPKSGPAPLSVQFSSAGSSDPEGVALTYSWSFGDGVTTNAANPLHNYTNNGTFTARLTVSDGVNTSSSTNLLISVTTLGVQAPNQAPVAMASAPVTSGGAPLSVAFSSAGSSDPEGATLTYSWSFGDGTNATTANPTHIYQASGVYTARLTVSDGTNTASSSNLTIKAANGVSSLVAAYGFEEGSGGKVTDVSGSGNAGTVSGATWTTGKFGKALSFDGNSLVIINDAASLDLTAGMTLEAWVYPTALGGWRDIIFKDTDIYFLMGSTPQGQAPDMGGIFASANVYGTTALPMNTWSHLAGTYDGTTMRFYVNGVQVASRAQKGPITTSTGALSIGGDTTNGQYWAGLIDEVRIYNRALNASEVLADMNTPVIGPLPLAPPQGLRVVGP